ncbi:Hypothetical protein NTJ_10935 [Nesidiocoris tenuis]|nr:Hypothetical protein NTJ_10935 [Nesidiocoris tenuis]
MKQQQNFWSNLVISGVLLISFSSNQVNSQCSKQDYHRCVQLADPLLKDPHLIYPDNPRDIENVCRTWTFFVDCVRDYTDRCFTEARRREFNKAVEIPVSSIHKLCSMPDYREDYLKHATCMKMTLTQDNHCGRHYRLLVSQVSSEAPTASVCCSHHMLRECVTDQAKNVCEPESAPYTAGMLDKALSFLKDQCSNYIPNQLDCPGSDFYKSTSPSRAETERRHMDQDIVNTRPTFIELGSAASSRSTHGRLDGSSRLPSTPMMTASRPSTTMTSSSSISTSTTLDSRGSGSANHPSIPSTSRTEPEPWTPTSSADDNERTSFGRGMTWRTIAGAPPTPESTWSKVSSGDIWFPSAKPPAMIDNSIDEPNQQGLGSEKKDNSGVRLGSSMVATFVTLMVTSTTFLFR